MIFDPDFLKKWLGNPCDFDGSFGNQCVDLYRMYCKEVLLIPQSPPVAGAKDIWDTYLTQYFDRIENTPEGVPEKGDIVIWGEWMGKYGHVGIFVSGNNKEFISFDQNFPVGSLCHLQVHKYTGVIGWLHPKGVAMNNISQADLDEAHKQIDNLQSQVNGLVKTRDDLMTQLSELKATSDGFRKQFNDFVASLAQKLNTRQETVEILAAVDTCITFEDKATELDRQLASQAQEYQKTIDSLTSEVNLLKTKLSELENKLANLQKPADNITIPKKSLLDFLKGLIWRS